MPGVKFGKAAGHSQLILRGGQGAGELLGAAASSAAGSTASN